MSTNCHRLELLARDLVAGDLSGSERDGLRTHVAECPTCARTIQRERALVAALRCLPPAPARAVPVPALPRRGRVLTTARVAALVSVAAAAALVVTLRWSVGERSDEGLEAIAPLGRPVVIRHVVQLPGHAPHPDDGLLALTAGVEAVVMRRPAQDR